ARYDTWGNSGTENFSLVVLGYATVTPFRGKGGVGLEIWSELVVRVEFPEVFNDLFRGVEYSDHLQVAGRDIAFGFQHYFAHPLEQPVPVCGADADHRRLGEFPCLNE